MSEATTATYEVLFFPHGKRGWGLSHLAELDIHGGAEVHTRSLCGRNDGRARVISQTHDAHPQCKDCARRAGVEADR